MRKYLIGAAGMAALAALSGPASAASLSYFTAALTPLSGSGVTGKANATLNTDDNTLAVQISASGLVPNMLHVQHIHGAFDGGVSGKPINSTTPTLAQDADGDGFIELLEGLTTYGPIIVPLDSASGAFPMAPNGTINFS